MYFSGISLITQPEICFLPQRSLLCYGIFLSHLNFRKKTLKDWGSFHLPLFFFTPLCESPVCSALAHEQVAAAQQITTCQLSHGNLGSCLPCMVLVCPRCEVMLFSWKLDERSLNWNRLKMQTWTVTEVWLTCSNSLSPVNRLCAWTLGLLADKTWSVHRTRTQPACFEKH